MGSGCLGPTIAWLGYCCYSVESPSMMPWRGSKYSQHGYTLRGTCETTTSFENRDDAKEKNDAMTVLPLYTAAFPHDLTVTEVVL